MPTNPYFNNFPNRYSQEQSLVEDLLNESIRMYGMDCYYIVRESITGSEIDLIYGEDPTAKFSKYYKIEMYMENVLDDSAGGEFMSRFNLLVNDNVNFLISRRSFARWVPSSIAIRPREGDLIYTPMTTNLYEIKYVKTEKNYYTLGRDAKLPYMYELSCEMFKHSQESISTGVDEIDEIELEGGYQIDMQLQAGSGNFFINERVYQGANLSVATATADVKSWSPANKIIKINNIKGIFANTGNITGSSSGVTYSILDYNPLTDSTPEGNSQNSEIENEISSLIDVSENNPFGQP